MATNALAPCITRSSAAIVSTEYNVDIKIFYEIKFQQPAPLLNREMMWNSNIPLCYLKMTQPGKGKWDLHFELINYEWELPQKLAVGTVFPGRHFKNAYELLNLNVNVV